MANTKRIITAGKQGPAGPAGADGPSVWGGISGLISAQADLQAALDAKATPAQITAAIDALIAGAPGALDTLNELAAALGDDANFAATVTAALAAKAADSAVVHDTGDESIDGVKTFTSSPIVPAPTTDFQAATKKYVDDNAGSVGDSALEFDATLLHHVEMGKFYTRGDSYAASPMFCELWLKPSLTAAGYHTVENNGGTHVLLFGSSGSSIMGNFANGAQANSYTSGEGSVPGGWAHHAILYIPQDYFAAGNPATPLVYTYINGILSSMTTLTNPRAAASASMQIGGTDHSNWDGRIAQWRIWEGSTPFAYNFVTRWPAFVPEWSFRGGTYIDTGPAGTADAPVSALYDFRNNTGRTIPDLGVGFDGSTHTGVLSSGYISASVYMQADNWRTNLPQWVVDPVTRPTRTVAAPTIPPSSILYDSFSRDDVTPAFDTVWSGSTATLDIGNLEKPSSLAWGATRMALIDGRLATIDSNGTTAIVDAGVSDQDVRVDSGSNAYTSMPGAVYARYTDSSNHIMLILWNSGNNWAAYEYVAGVAVQNAGGAATPDSASSLRIVVSGTAATFYYGATLLGTMAGLTLPAGTKAGFQIAGLGRVSEFAVY